MKQTAWAVLLCRFKDTNFQRPPLGIVNRLFTTIGGSTFNVPLFFSDMSHGMLDLSVSRVFPQGGEFFEIDAMLNDYVAPTDPPPTGWTQTLSRDEMWTKAAKAASDAGVPLSI